MFVMRLTMCTISAVSLLLGSMRLSPMSWLALASKPFLFKKSITRNTRLHSA